MKTIKHLAISEILILLIGIVAFGYVLGSEVGGVSAIGIVPPPASAFNPASGGSGKGFFGTIGNVFKDVYESGIVGDFAAAAGIYLGIKLLGPLITSDKEAIDAAAKAASIGYLASQGASALGAGSLAATGIGAAVAVAIFFLTYKKTEEIKISYTCEVWDAQTGGRNCEACNDQKGLPCTEYQCKSLGQACELINKGTTEEKCVWVNQDDVNPPIIQPWNEALLSSEYRYTPDNTISPPDRGVFIRYKNDCIPAFTPFKFGIELDENAKCKIDPDNKATFDEMRFFFGGSSTSKKFHEQTISLPGPEALEAENLTLENDGNFNLYVRCEDPNGNKNTANFVFKYCVEPGPDTTPPLIVGTSILDNTPVAFNQSSVDIELYINEPAECRWTHDRDNNFVNMENNMTCSKSVFEMNAQMLYKCSTTLTGLKDRETNVFYFRCKDKPFPGVADADRNVNSEGFRLRLLGSQPLVIDSVGPEGTIKGSSEVVKVTLEAETSAGYKEGDSTCYYSTSCYDEDGSKTDYTAFYYPEGTSSHAHSQDIFVNPGTYQCSIKCVDLGGNTDSEEFTYTVEVDESPPRIVRAYRQDNFLTIITDEEASCVYSSSSTTACSYLFTDGIVMKSFEEKEHFVDWNTDRTYYIKCQDDFTNQPLPNQCSIIVRPNEDFS